MPADRIHKLAIHKLPKTAPSTAISGSVSSGSVESGSGPASRSGGMSLVTPLAQEAQADSGRVGESGSVGESGGGGERTTRVQVLNENGLHIRPCNAILVLAQAHEAELSLTKITPEGEPLGAPASARSATSLLMLSGAPGDWFELRATGKDAAALIHEAERLFQSRFDLPEAAG